MSAQASSVTPAGHVGRAKAELAAGDHTAAQTHALIAIAELLLPRRLECAPIEVPEP